MSVTLKKRITIDPITRLEGHGKIEIFLNDEGDVENTYLQIPELRGFEKFCVGRPVEEIPRIVTRICGVCPASHHMAAAKAVDAVYHVDIPHTAKKLREMYYLAHFIHSHHAHFYALAAPDLLVGPDGDPAKRNVLGIIEKVGVEIGKQVLMFRRLAQEAQGIIGGRFTHLVWCIPGGVSKHLTKEDVEELRVRGKKFLELTAFTIKVFNDMVLGNPALVDLILKGPYVLKSHQMGLVDENNKVNFYDGMVRVVDVEGQEICKYEAKDYKSHVAEHVEPWSYLKFPYLKAKGWKGFVEGMDSGVYCATPLSRLNVSDGMTTPRAQEEYERMFSILGGKPCHYLMANHWARLVEMMYSAEKFMEYVEDPDITDDNVHKVPSETPTEGVGIVEAMRGTLTHNYKTDENGIVTEANLIVGTTNNNATINIAIRKAAESVIERGKEVTEGILNRIEMAFRTFDPCFSCATHSLPGKMPMIVNIYDSKKTLIQTLRRDS